jgi:hypothetical protein
MWRRRNSDFGLLQEAQYITMAYMIAINKVLKVLLTASIKLLVTQHVSIVK